MLSYKEYKLLNESLYGAFNLGLRSHGTVGGIVSGSSINGTEAAIEAEAEEAIEEAKKMKKKMEDEEELLDNPKSEKDSDEEEGDDEEESDDDDDNDSDDEEEGDDDDDSDDEDSDEEEEVEDKKKDFAFMKKKMKKKSKKEWSEVMSDLEDLLEVVEDEDALNEVKKGLEMMKKGMEKGMDGGCGKGGKYMKKGMDGGCKKCGKYMSEGKKHRMKNHKPECKCPMCSGENKFGKKMNEADQAWWDSVNSMLGANPDQKNWDGGWSEVGEVQQAVREDAETNE
jgi:hypothetical protein